MKNIKKGLFDYEKINFRYLGYCDILENKWLN